MSDKLKEKHWVLASEDKVYQARKSSQGCDLKIYCHEDQITCGTFTIPPNMHLGRISAHRADETYYIIKGTLKVNLPRLDETVEVKQGELFYMPGGMIHAPFNDGQVDCVVLWHCAPDWP